MNGFRIATAATALVAGIALGTHADDTPQSQSIEIQLQLGDVFTAEGRYQDALEAYRNAVKVAPPDRLRQARSGLIQSALRTAEFDIAREEAEKLIAENPRLPDSQALYGDALW